MQATRRLLAAHRQPLIKFLGKHAPPASIDHTPRAHPMSPTGVLPDSFATYRQKAQQHGPLSSKLKGVGSTSGASLGPIGPREGEFFDRSELPPRFQRLPWTQAEIDAIESGGASMFS